MDRYQKVKKRKAESPIAANEIQGSPRGRGRGVQGGRGRGSPRPPSGNCFASGEFEDGGYERNLGNFRGRGRGGGRKFRGRERGGGYGGPRFEGQHEDTEGYNYQEAPRGCGSGRGRERGMVNRGSGRGFFFNGQQVDPGAEGAQVWHRMVHKYTQGYNYQEAPRGNGFASWEFKDGGYERNLGNFRGRGRGGGRNFRGRERGGGYGGPRFVGQHEDTEGYNYQEAPRGRGRERGKVNRGFVFEGQQVDPGAEGAQVWHRMINQLFKKHII